MDDAITDHQREKLSEFVLTTDRFSQGQEVRKFEEQWSQWQGCKYSVFCNSGSSANFLIVQAMNNLNNPPGWISQACTWATTVSPVLLSNRKLQLCDVELPSLSPDKDTLLSSIESLKTRTRMSRPHLFLAHLLGFCAIDQELLDIIEENNITLLEDCCESHGASFGGKKIGNFGKASSFSFYYGHHMTTIEGGMVCTDDEDIYEQLLLLRSHGLMRELPDHLQEKYKDQIVDKSFTFKVPGYNLRSTDFNALLGQLQLENLDEHNQIRTKNFNRFASRLDGDRYYANFKTDGNCSFCFPVITKSPDETNRLRDQLENEGVETRPIIAGNLYEHPFMQKQCSFRYDRNAKIVHNNGFYVGNNHMVTLSDVDWLVDTLNGVLV